jgi:hypothetical protein
MNNSRRVHAPKAHRGAWSLIVVLMVGMPILSLIPKYFLIEHIYPAAESIFDPQFADRQLGFIGYTESLVRFDRFRTCPASPYVACDPKACAYATRMPVMPWLIADLTKVVGFGTVNVALAKMVVTSLLASIFLAILSLDLRLSVARLIVLYGLYFGPQVLKHASSLEYEETILVDLIFCFSIAVCYLIRPDITGSALRRNLMALAAVVLACAMYFAKATMLPVLVVAMALALSNRRLPWKWKVASVIIVAMPFALWGYHNLQQTGQLRFTSSWDGENLYRGYNSLSLAIYPEVNLTRILDSSAVTLANGSVVTLEDSAHQACYRDEWAWNDHYAAAAHAWLLQHPLSATWFLMKKAWVALIEVRHTPGDADPVSHGVAAAMVTWMIFARCVSVAFVIAALRRIFKGRITRGGITQGDRREAFWALLLLGAAFSPFVIVFAYQRHVIPLLLMAGTLLVILFQDRVVLRDQRL